MKRSWQFGLLAIGITGVSTYDVLFYKGYHSQPPPAIQREARNTTPATSPLSTVAPAPGSPAPDNTSEQMESNPLPPISKEELQRKAHLAFELEESPIPEKEKAWPNRNPFAVRAEPKAVKSDLAELSPLKNENPKKENLAPVNLPEPECVLTGTLIDQKSRLALIDGAALSVGARIGSWQIARIESDYIILQSGESVRRIELSARRQIARKEPL
jgi:hypothetical protein